MVNFVKDIKEMTGTSMFTIMLLTALVSSTWGFQISTTFPKKSLALRSSAWQHPIIEERSQARRIRSSISKISCIEFAQPELATFPQQMFTLVNFAVLPFWGFMIFAPNFEGTQKLMTTSIPILVCAAIHLSLVSFGLTQPGSAEEFQFLATQGFVKLSAMMQMRQYPVFVAEEWAHVLAWDLFVGRWIYLDGLKKGIPTPHSLFFCFLLGPLGFSLHLITRALVKRDLSTILTLD